MSCQDAKYLRAEKNEGRKVGKNLHKFPDDATKGEHLECGMKTVTMHKQTHLAHACESSQDFSNSTLSSSLFIAAEASASGESHGSRVNGTRTQLHALHISAASP
eukprot:1350174-Amphidinium_carterae.1